MSRIVNIGYRCCGYNFDAAVDCDWELHCYDEKRNDVTPIELYCFDKPEWDIRMMFHKEPQGRRTNDQQKDEHFGGIYNTCANFDEILEETKAWIKEMTNNV